MVSAEIFPFWRIAMDATVSAVVSMLVLLLLRSRFKLPNVRGIGEVVLVSVVVGLSVLAWRSFANVPELNGDPVPGVSPADALSPIITYVCLGLYAAFGPVHAMSSEGSTPRGWAQARAALALVAFVVNVVVI